MHLLLLPLTGAFLVIRLASLLVTLFALVDAASRPEAAFVSTGKRTKQFWLALLGAGTLLTLIGFFPIFGLVAAIVYIVDVRAAIIRR